MTIGLLEWVRSGAAESEQDKYLDGDCDGLGPDDNDLNDAQLLCDADVRPRDDVLEDVRDTNCLGWNQRMYASKADGCIQVLALSSAKNECSTNLGETT
jgi:hypothetical protein